MVFRKPVSTFPDHAPSVPPGNLNNSCAAEGSTEVREHGSIAIMQHASIDVAAMIGGIKRWVETESPTQSTAAVNRMIDLVQSDVSGLPVTVERGAGGTGFG